MLEKQIAFINELEKLKTVTRQNLTLDGRQENSAEHSWHAAMMALTLQEYFPPSTDFHKVLRLLLVHDLGEIYVGDTSLYEDEAREAASAREKASLPRLLGLLGEKQSKGMLDLWEEFEQGQTPEAQAARVIDALNPLIGHLATAQGGYNPQKISAQKVLEKKRFIQKTAPKLWPLVESTIEQSVKKGLYLMQE
jgi:putative hydrolase of HD superfamily